MPSMAGRPLFISTRRPRTLSLSSLKQFNRSDKLSMSLARPGGGTNKPRATGRCPRRILPRSRAVVLV
jgi:hypothetical protein